LDSKHNDKRHKRFVHILDIRVGQMQSMPLYLGHQAAAVTFRSTWSTTPTEDVPAHCLMAIFVHPP
jgi:hypothetical protein